METEPRFGFTRGDPRIYGAKKERRSPMQLGHPRFDIITLASFAALPVFGTQPAVS
jgi:hypothetical protein